MTILPEEGFGIRPWVKEHEHFHPFVVHHFHGSWKPKSRVRTLLPLLMVLAPVTEAMTDFGPQNRNRHGPFTVPRWWLTWALDTSRESDPL